MSTPLVLVALLACGSTPETPADPEVPPAAEPSATKEPASEADAGEEPTEEPELPASWTAPLMQGPDDGWVAAVLEATVPQAKRCQTIVNDKVPGIAGTAVLVVTLKSGDATVDVEEDDSEQTLLGRCLAGHLRRAEWPAHRSGTFRSTWTWTSL